ncbi:thiamine-phosphate kinase [Acidithiobacillus sp. M4-SHS-6]|uniref:thiamine-phosphate kinase n=1 Tax=Acidithiobacillus sp. M4-SHS-6 TaxID=3383024 RepID=UPI0039BE6B62
MANEEFALIAQLQKSLGHAGKGVLLGMGDDAAWLDTEGRSLVSSMDTLVAGRHFFVDVHPADLAWKALAVNLSDLAAMGAIPRWCLLSLALPPLAEGYGQWLQDFVAGWRELAEMADVALVGGDTVATDGPLTLSITALGVVEQGVMRRDAASVGDLIWVTGTLGDAAAALDRALVARGLPGWDLDCSEACAQALENRRLRPLPRLDFARAARAAGVACALDCSDGFLADLGHILRASGLRARVDLESLPLSSALSACIDGDLQRLQRWPLTGGDDYELIFCAPPTLTPILMELAETRALPITAVGQILPAEPQAPEDVDLYWQGLPLPLPESRGHQHVF